MILSTGLNGLALGLLALPVAAAPHVAMPANLPLFFESSPVQANIPAGFITRGHDFQFTISPAEVQIVLRRTGAAPAGARLQFAGANAQAPIHGDTELPGKINYLTGSNPAQWRTGVPMFAQVSVSDLYPGVDLVYYGNQQRLEYDFTVAPGANPQAITMHFDGADKIAISPQNDLILSLAGGEIRQPKPVIYQTTDGVRKEIEGGYRMVDAHTVAFAVGEYDRRQPLVIDPFLTYSTYFGGSAGETAFSVALDSDANVYITGQTLSTQFSATNSFSTAGAFQTNFAGGNVTGDAFIYKLYASNATPAYITYLGGSADDEAFGIALDSAGNAYVAGLTDSANFPTTTNALFKTIGGVVNPSLGVYPADAFVAELSSSGSNLIYSTYLGGSQADSAYGIAVDSSGNAYVTGVTYSTNFPTANAIQKQLACNYSLYFNANAFIAKIGPGGSPLVYSTYLGGTNLDEGKSIAVDTNGFAYVAGFTFSTNFPTTNAFQQTLNRSTNLTSFSSDAFVAKLDPAGSGLVYLTLLGSTNNDAANGIAVDNTGAAYVTGWTVSSNFPNTVGTTIPGLQSFLATNTSFTFLVTNAFLTKITNGASAGIAWSALFGGNGVDVGNAVALDAAGDVFVTGSASSTNFPSFNVPTRARYTNSGQSDAFVIAFSAAATNLLYSTYLGGQNSDYGYGIAVNTTNGDAYVVGQTFSKNFPIQTGATNLNGTSDGFLSVIVLTMLPPVITTPTNNTYLTNSVGSSITLNVFGTGTSPFYFQWQKDLVNLTDGPNISGATNNVLTINPAQTTNSGQYSLIITNYGGAATSFYFIVTVTNIPPSISTNGQPISQTNGVGTSVTFAVFGAGTEPLGFQWKFEGSNLVNGTKFSGVTNNVLTISNVQLTNAGNYSVTITNMAGSVTSSNALLTVQAVPIVIVQPATNQSIAVGSSATFAVTAIGTVPLLYQWWNGTNKLVNGSFGGATISGATTSQLFISNAQSTNSSTNYFVIVTNVAGSVTSSVAVLSVTNIPPAITVQPISQTNGVGTTVTLAVTATGTAPLSYHWQLEGTNLVNGGHYNGVTTNVLTISTVQLTNAGNYSVVITNFGGSVTSSNALLTVFSVPVIVKEPATNLSIAVGSNATFNVSAIGTGPLSYQWWNGTNKLANGGSISGVTTTNLIFSNAQTTNSSTNYFIIVTNVAGSVTSSVASLTVTNIPPKITLQPTNQALPVGSNVTMVVNAIGTAPLSYQWQVNGTNLVNGGQFSGVTTNVMKISGVQATNSGSYTVIVTNFGGSATSSNAVLTVTNTPPTITLQPTNQTVSMGTLVSFVVTATGPGPLSYQWQVDGTNLLNGGNITGATTNILKFSNVQTNNSSTNFSVVVTNLGGSVTSSVVSLTVLGAPVITLQPASQTNSVGSTATFAVSASGAIPLSYHWQLNGTNLINGGSISGVTTTNLIISNAQTNSSGNYAVVVTNLAGSVTSSNAVLLVTNIPPAITVQPISQTVGVGTNVTLVVTATGTAPLSYHWQLEGTNLVNGGHFSGVTTNVLTISTVQLTNAGNYSVVITNYGGSVTSSNALLTVQDSPIIIMQPASQTNSVGSTAVFTVNAIGAVPLTYQWWNGTNKLVNGNFSGGVTVSGTTTSQLAIFNAQTTNSASYTVIVSNSVGSVTSSNAVLLVTNIAPVITVPPTNQAWPAGSNIFLVVTATGTAPLIYQWQLNGTNLVNGGQLSGATTNVLKISNAQTNNSGTNYSVIVTNFGGSVTSAAVSLTVASSPIILTQPMSQTVVVGSTPGFEVTAVGILPLSYQWQLNGTNLVDGSASGFVIQGATTPNLTLGNVQTTNTSPNYTVIVSNSLGSVTSSNAVLTVTNIPPTITLQPTNQTVAAGSTATLVVAAAGTPPFTYQWQVVQLGVTNLLVDGGQFSGSTNATLTIDNVQPANNGSYSVTVMNPGGSVLSSNAVLTVLMAPPIFGQVMAAEGGGFILSGTGGASNATYKVLTSSNLLVPLTNWTYILTDQFDSDGNFIFTNTTPTNAPQLFYILQLP